MINSVSLVELSSKSPLLMKNNPKKQQIIKAAQKRFLRHGLSKTTVEEIARDLRIGKATVYHYFNSKEEIFYEVLKGENERYLETITALFGNSSTSFDVKVQEYLKFKTSLRELFPLLYELIFLIINDKAIDKELELFRNLIEKEELLAAELFKVNMKERSEDNNARSLVYQSFGSLFTSIINKALYGEHSVELQPANASAEKPGS